MSMCSQQSPECKFTYTNSGDWRLRQSRGTEIDGQKWSERMLLYITQYRLHPFVEHMGVR